MKRLTLHLDVVCEEYLSEFKQNVGLFQTAKTIHHCQTYTERPSGAGDSRSLREFAGLTRRFRVASQTSQREWTRVAPHWRLTTRRVCRFGVLSST
jgi:hypothetical protein